TVVPINTYNMSPSLYNIPIVVLNKTSSNGSVWSSITNPLNGFYMIGDFIQVHSEIVNGDISDISQIAFYYKKLESLGNWELMTIKDMTNPIPSSKIKSAADLYVNWNITGIDTGSYLIKSEITDKYGIKEPNPTGIMVVKMQDNFRTAPIPSMTALNENVIKSDYYFYPQVTPFYPDTLPPILVETVIPNLKGDNEVKVYAEQTAGEGNNFSSNVKLEVPGDAIPPSIYGKQKIIMSSFNPLTLGRGFDAAVTPAGDTSENLNVVLIDIFDSAAMAQVTSLRDIVNTLVDKQSYTNLLKPFTLEMSYLDENNDGWVDNMPNMREEWLKIFYKQAIGSGWNKIEPQLTTYDFEKNIVTCTFAHFTFFTLYYDVDAIPPAPENVYNLTAEVDSTTNNTIEIKWIENKDTDIIYYYVYQADTVTKEFDFNNPIDTIPAPATTITLPVTQDEEQIYCILPIDEDRLIPDVETYTPPVIVIENNILNGNGAVWSSVSNPLNGFNVSGNYVQVKSKIVKGQLSYIKEICFYYKKAGTNGWTKMLNKSGYNPVLSKNILNEADLYANWDISQLSDGEYIIKSVVTDKNNVEEPFPVGVKIIKGTQAVSDYWVNETDPDVPIIVQTIIPGLQGDNIITQYENTTDVYGNPTTTKVEISLPGNSLDTSTSAPQKIVVTTLDNEAVSDYNVNPPAGDSFAGFTVIVIDLYDASVINAGDVIEKLITQGQKTELKGNGVIIKLSYLDNNNDGWIDNMNGIREEWLRMFYRENTNENWNRISDDKITSDYVLNTITCKFNHFTMFSLFPDTGIMPAISSGSETVAVYPNPYIPSSNGDQGRQYSIGSPSSSGIIFDGLSDGTIVKIYTIRGQLVWDYTHTGATKMKSWDVKNLNGRDVASGWYLYVIDKPGRKKITGKLAVIR
nr:hypothetical protein [bacterium]